MTELQFNSSTGNLDREYTEDNISEGMYKICTHLTNKGFPTVNSCSGHGRMMAYIDFNTKVTEKSLDTLFSDNKSIFVFSVTNSDNTFTFRRIKFVYNDETVSYLLNI